MSELSHSEVINLVQTRVACVILGTPPTQLSLNFLRGKMGRTMSVPETAARPVDLIQCAVSIRPSRAFSLLGHLHQKKLASFL